jgi:predicted aspartyl protease
MKGLLLLLLFGCIKFTTVQAQPSNHHLYDRLLSRKSFFMLRQQLSYESQLSQSKKMFYTALCENYFNQPFKSSINIDKLLKKYQKELSESDIAQLIKTNVNNYLRLFLYKKALAENELLLTKYQKYLTALEVEEAENNNNLLSGLVNVQPQTVKISKDTRITTKKDLAGLINIPVALNDSANSYVFDTGANFSVITESNAKKYGLQLMDFYFDVKAITGKMVKGRMGLLKKLKIGDIELANVVFLVFPDGSLSFADGKYVINGIIGFPVIEQLGEIRMNKAGYIDVPKIPVHQPYANLGLDELTPVVNVKTNSIFLPYTFDTGAELIVLNKCYYALFKNEIDSIGKPAEIALGGAAGVTKLEGFKLPLWQSLINGLPVKLKEIDVKTVSTTDRDEFYYGNIGQDVIQQFSEMTINFKSMYLSFKE